jgi:site-specific recombinase XerD
MSVRIDTVASRNRLKARRDPYYQRMGPGLFVGYRKMVSGIVGTWSVRLRDEDTGKQHLNSLGTLEQYPDHERFDKAAAEAKAMFDHAKSGGVIAVKTVRQVCDAYVEHLRQNKSEAAAQDAQKRFNTYVLDDHSFAALELQKLKPVHISDWRQRLANRPIRKGSGRGKNPSIVTDKKRSPSSLNRDMTPFRAALNHALDNAWITNNFAWRAKLKPIENADKQRDGGYITRQERQNLIDAAAADGSGVETIARVLCALPVRPGALAKLQVKHFNASLNELSIKFDKTGERKITLPASTSKIFAEACKNKLPEASIFTRPDGSAWNKDSWKAPFKRAVRVAGLNESTVMYSLRHAILCDMVTAGVDLLTVSRLSGTSITMIQKHYGHLIPSIGAAAIEKVAI